MNNKIYLLILYIATIKAISIKDVDTFFDKDVCIEGKIITTNNGALIMHNEDIYKIEENNVIDNKPVISNSELKVTTKIKDEAPSKANNKIKNARELLNEIANFNNIQINYSLIKEEGPSHLKQFYIKLTFGDETYFKFGKSMKEVQMKLATEALKHTKYKILPQTPNTLVAIATTQEELTPTVQLNNIVAKLGIKILYIMDNGEILHNEEIKNEKTSTNSKDPNYYSLYSNYLSKLNDSVYNENHTISKKIKMSTVNEASVGPFTVRLEIGDLKTFIGVGLSIQAARHEAANLALEYFKTMSIKEAEECINEGVVCNKLHIKSPISITYEIATKQGLNIDYQLIDTKQIDKQPMFTYLCILGDLTSQGEGTSKKLAKKKAAENMIKELNQAIPVSSSIDVINDQVKKSKKKKNKVTRNSVVDDFSNTVASIYNYFSTSDINIKTDDFYNHDHQDHNSEFKNKNEFLTLMKNINIDVKYSSFQITDVLFSTIISLETEPSYICYGKDSNRAQSEDEASLAALNFIKSIGFDNIIIPLNKNKGNVKLNVHHLKKEASPLLHRTKEL